MGETGRPEQEPDPRGGWWRRPGADRRGLAGLGAAVAVTALVVLVPAPEHRPQTTPAPPATGLAAAWPDARPLLLPRTLPDGSGYEPRMILDRATSVGLRTSGDGLGVDLVQLAAADPAHPRVLAADLQRGGVVVDAVTATADQVFWLASQPGADGAAHGVLWAADQAGGPPRVLTTDTGRAAVSSSQDDLRVVDGRVWWVSTVGISPVLSQLRSVATTGGKVTVLDLDDRYAPTTWPWLVSDPGRPGAPVVLLDPTTGQRRTVTATANQRLTCSLVWCRIMEPGQPHDTVVLVHPDGSGRRRVADDGAQPATADVAISDRFVVLAALLPAVRTTAVETLTLVDLATGRRVPVAVVTSRSGRDGWLWWAGNPDSDPDWHLLHLAELR